MTEHDITELLSRRSDLSTFLVHFTRDMGRQECQAQPQTNSENNDFGSKKCIRTCQGSQSQERPRLSALRLLQRSSIGTHWRPHMRDPEKKNSLIFFRVSIH